MLYTVLAILAAAASVPDNGYEVHEWGVVLYRADFTRCSGSSGGPWYDPYNSCAEAPVVNIYGPAFEGRFTVTSPARIFDVYPEPEGGVQVEMGWLGLVYSAAWDGLAGRPLVPGETPWSSTTDVGIPGFLYALSSWRLAESLVLSRSSDSWCDRFLYYEVDLTGTSFPLPLEGSPSADSSQAVSGQILVFHRDEYGVVTMEIEAGERSEQSEEVLMLSQPYLPEGAYDVLTSWAGSALTRSEIQALWATWEPYILWGDWQGSTLTVFPIPESLYPRISTLRLETDPELPVEYTRFFLGIAETP